MPDIDLDALTADLTALGRALPDPEPGSAVVVAVMERIADLPNPAAVSPSRRLLGDVVAALARHRRRATLVLTALVLSLLLAPPVRAAVADWFSFAGVIVRHDSTPRPRVAPPAPTARTAVTLDEANGLVAFEPLVPAALGSPQGVEVSPDGRVLSMSWTSTTDGVVRLDEFDARLDFRFAKSASGVEFTSVDGDFALWFDKPHDVVLLDADGTSRAESARLAGNTLIWTGGRTTLRLEGQLSRGRAIEIAESVSAVH
jgi:hypothetical protein